MKKKQATKAAAKVKATEEAEFAAEKEARDYKHVMTEDAMQSNKDVQAGRAWAAVPSSHGRVV